MARRLNQLRLKARQILDWFYAWNIDVFLMYGIVSVAYIQRMTGWRLQWEPFFALALANLFGVAGVYLLNRVTDDYEDSINGRGIGRATFQYGYGVAWLLLSAACLLYVTSESRWIWLCGLLLTGLGVMYSFPKKYRLKSIPIVKNVVPALCWTLSLAALITVGKGDISLLQSLTRILPLFFLALAFEIYWDIPDVTGDRAAKVRTLPVSIGVSATKWILGIYLGAILFLIHSVPARVFALVLLASLLLITRHTKTMYHHVLTILMIVVAGVNGVLYYYPPASDDEVDIAKVILSDTTVLEYEYADWSGALPKPETTLLSRDRVLLRQIGEGRYVYERIGADQKSIVFDVPTLTVTETWKHVPFHYLPVIRSTGGDVAHGQNRQGLYRVTPREGSICAEDVLGDFTSVTNPPAKAAYVFNGKKTFIKTVTGVQSGTWKHCETTGRISFAYKYLPGSNLLTAFEGTVYYGEVPERTVYLRLKNIQTH